MNSLFWKKHAVSILRRLERFTHTDMVYLIRNGFWLSFSQVFASILSFILAIVFANAIPKETYGTYKYIMSIVGMLAITALPGIDDAVLQAAARGKEGPLRPAIKEKITWGLLGSIISFVLAGYYFAQQATVIAEAFLIVGAFIPLVDTFYIFDAYLHGKKQFQKSSRYFALVQITYILSMIVTLLMTSNLLIIVGVYFASLTVMRFACYRIVLKTVPPSDVQDPDLLSNGRHLSFMNVLGFISNNLDRLLIFHYLGAADVAIYSIAISPPEQIKGYLKNLYQLALPKFSERTEQELKAVIHKKVIIFTMGIAAIVALYILAAPLLFHMLFPAYTESVIYTQVYAFSLLPAGSMLYYAALQSQMKIKKLYVFNTAAPLIQIALQIILIVFFGLMGAIIAKITTRVINLFLTFWLTGKTTSEPSINA